MKISKENYEEWLRGRWARQPGRDPLRNLCIMGLGIGGEAGEVQEHLKKFIRDDKVPGTALLLELGDVIHYAIRIGQEFGYSLDDILTANVERLERRDLEGKR